MVHNHEKKWDYYLNPSLSKLTNKLWFYKMVGRKAFLTKQKHQYHLSQWGEWVYDSQSWKKRWLLRESMINQIDKQTLILKNGGKRSYSYKTKVSMSFIPMTRRRLWFKIIRRKEIIMSIRVYLNRQTNFDSRNWWEEILTKPTRQCHLSQ